MPWDEVARLLLTRVVPLMKERPRGEEWVASLPRCADGELLGVCIGIDIATGAIQPKVFAKIVDRIDPTADVREEFGKIVNNPPVCDDVICMSNFSASTPLNDEYYVRVLELGNFIRFCVDKGYTRSPSHVKRIRTMYFSAKDGVELSGVRKWYRGRLPNVWVTSFDDLDELLDGVGAKERGDIVLDSFGQPIRNGVGKGNKPELVAVRYPNTFSVGCVQPTTLDAWWVDAGGFYLSYRNEDDWGRTQSLSGTRAAQRERVHSLFKNLTAGYRTLYIGTVRSVVEDRDELLVEGYRRFADVTRSSTV